MIIDAHTHIGKLPNSPLKRTTFGKITALFLKEMKNSGVSHAFLLPSFDKNRDDEVSLENALRLTKDEGRVSVVGTIDVLNYTEAELKRLAELLANKKVIGVKLYPGYQYFYPNEAICNPIYELCVKFDVPVIFHSGDTLNYETYAYETYAKVKYSHPLHIDDVAADFPKLKIVIAHMGNPWLIDCAEILYKNENVYADLSGLVVQENLDSPYGKLMKRKIQDLMTYSSPRKLLYGTDWPLIPMKPYIEFVKSLNVSSSDLDHIFYKNAQNLFKV